MGLENKKIVHAEAEAEAEAMFTGAYWFSEKEEIEKAIKEFGERPIGSGGFGNPEFNNELKLISMFHHKNIIDFIGYYDKGNDMILVFDYATKVSLERHLEKPDKDRPITWAERLKICIGAAKGLKYLYFGAKICDFGLSKCGPDDQPYSKLFTKAMGTKYYIDPSYQESGILRIESDVYSFGVVMFELIPAWQKRSFRDSDRQFLINLARRYYNKGLDKLVDPLVKDKIGIGSFRTFIDIAYKCIDLDLEKRPTMVRIIYRIEDAMELQLTPFSPIKFDCYWTYQHNPCHREKSHITT
ncbi:putative receptor-like protein kinase [Tanacetum coccineum]